MKNQAQIYAHNMNHFMSNPLVQNLINVGDEEHTVMVKEELPSIDIFWQLYEERCPNCGNALTDYDNYEFTRLNGECLGCNHVRGEIDAMKMLEARDQMTEYMMSFGEYGEGL